MTLLNPAGLALLAAVPVLVLLAWLTRGAQRRETGTLFLWRDVAREATAQTRKPRLDVLLLVLAAALTAGALAAARPALTAGDGGPPRVAVFIERLRPAGDETDLDEVRTRAQAEAPGAVLELHAGEPRRSPITEQLTNFALASRGADARLLFLCEPDDAAGALGRVLPRVTVPRDGVVFAAGLSGSQLLLRSSGAATPKLEGAELEGAQMSGGETLRRFKLREARVEIQAPHTPSLALTRRPPLSLAAAPPWDSGVHLALLRALGNARLLKPGETCDVGIGGADGPRRLRTGAGDTLDLRGATVTFAGEHALFEDLPLADFDWLADGRGLKPEEGVIALVSARREGGETAHLATLSADGLTLTFAADPFARSPAASAALLLDNALGVLLGQRPSERADYVLEGELPGERAAFAAPFEPRGKLELDSRATRPLELGPWPAALAAALCLAAAWLGFRRPRQGLSSKTAASSS